MTQPITNQNENLQSNTNPSQQIGTLKTDPIIRKTYKPRIKIAKLSETNTKINDKLNTTPKLPVKSNLHKPEKTENVLLIPSCINGQQTYVVFDTGANKNCIDSKLVPHSDIIPI